MDDTEFMNVDVGDLIALIDTRSSVLYRVSGTFGGFILATSDFNIKNLAQWQMSNETEITSFDDLVIGSTICHKVIRPDDVYVITYVGEGIAVATRNIKIPFQEACEWRLSRKATYN